jgi:hypothetical protein
VLIGTPTSGQPGGQIERTLMQLRSRQIAVEQIETYSRQESAAVKERELREAESRARQQQLLTESEVSIQVQSNQGKADFARAQPQAAQIQTLAGAEGVIAGVAPTTTHDPRAEALRAEMKKKLGEEKK